MKQLILLSILLLFISDNLFGQTSVRDDSTETYLKFSKNVITGINLTKEYLNTQETSTYKEAGKYISNATQILNNYDSNYSNIMSNNARKIIENLKEAYDNVERNKLTVTTILKITEVRTDNYLKMIFLPKTRKVFE